MRHQLLVFLRMSRNGKNIIMVVKQKVSHLHHFGGSEKFLTLAIPSSKRCF